MAKKELLDKAKEAKKIWEEIEDNSVKENFIKYFHLRPTKDGNTIVSTHPEKPMNGKADVKTNNLKNQIVLCSEEVKKETIDWNRLDIIKGDKGPESHIQAWIINVINNYNNNYDSYYKELINALGVKQLYFIGSELIFQEENTKGSQKPDIVVHDGNGNIYMLEVKQSKGDPIEKAKEQVDGYVKFYQNDKLYKDLLLDYPMSENLNNIEKYIGFVIVGEKGRTHIERVDENVIKVPEL